ncbi:unnamed protein product [Heterobilharzia americana]|nr:unnamed protein product [Heterobilharzia americana]
MPATSNISGETRSHSFHSSNSSHSKRSKATTYRTISRYSNVDENLFGVPLHVKERQCRLENQNNNNVKELEIIVSRRKMPGEVVPWEECETEKENQRRKKIRHYSSDLVRDLIIPLDYVGKKGIVIPPEKYSELQQKSKVPEDAEAKLVAALEKSKQESMMEASQQRKQKMREYDLNRARNEGLTDLEEEARKQAEAIRDEQILEKGQIKKEMAAEELRLDNMMELARQNAIHIQEEIDKKRKEQEMVGACMVLEQIEQNKQDRLLELERAEQENALAMQRIAEEHMKEIANREKKRKSKKNIEQS